MTTHININCRFCQGPRPTANGVCLGCGAPVERAEIKSRKRTRKPRICPRCASGSYKLTGDEGRFICRMCLTVFEDYEFGFVDDRADVNAMKKERRG